MEERRRLRHDYEKIINLAGGPLIVDIADLRNLDGGLHVRKFHVEAACVHIPWPGQHQLLVHVTIAELLRQDVFFD